jgi:hypothetical protein
MFRVAARMPLAVISPQPWFPFQGLIRRLKPNYRPPQPNHETQQGIDVWFPRFLSLPGVARWLDGFFMALSCLLLVRRLRRERGINLLDSHFAYPEGYAATLLGRWLNLPVTITLRGTEVPLARDPARRKRMLRAIHDASRVFAVADSLKRHVVSLGADPARSAWSATASTATSFSRSIARPRASSWVAAGCEGPRLGRRAGRAQGISSRDRAAARSARALPGSALLGGRWRLSGRAI